MTVAKHAAYDIVIVGAGLVGTSIALGLHPAGWRVAVLEKNKAVTHTVPTVDHRPLSLAYGNRRHLEQWDVWSSLAASAAPIQALHVSEEKRLGRVLLTARENNLPALGYVLPFSLLQQQLYRAASEQTHNDLIVIDDLSAIHASEQGVRVSYTASGVPHDLSAQLLIVADGKHSQCRTLLHMAVQESATEQVAWIATVECEQPHQQRAYQRWTKDGSLALLPLACSTHYRLVWLTDRPTGNQIEQRSDAYLLKQIAAAYGGRLGPLVHLKREAVLSVPTRIATEITRPAVVLLGDAAQALQPVMAQGFNLALHDVAVLVQVLQAAKQQGQTIGAYSTLQRYTEQRRAYEKAIVRWTQGFSSLTRDPLFAPLRGLALLGMDMMAGMKTRFVQPFLHIQ